MLVEKICWDLDGVVGANPPPPSLNKRSFGLTFTDVNDILTPSLLNPSGGGPVPFSLELSGLQGNMPPPNKKKDDCVLRNSTGICVYTRDQNGKLQLTPEYKKLTCRNYRALQRSYQQLGAVSAVGSGATVLDAASGGSVGALSRISIALGRGHWDLSLG